MLRHIQEFSLLLQMLTTAESSTAVADATGTRMEDTNSIKMETTTPYNGKGDVWPGPVGRPGAASPAAILLSLPGTDSGLEPQY